MQDVSGIYEGGSGQPRQCDGVGMVIEISGEALQVRPHVATGYEPRGSIEIGEVNQCNDRSRALGWPNGRHGDRVGMESLAAESRLRIAERGALQDDVRSKDSCHHARNRWERGQSGHRRNALDELNESMSPAHWFVARTDVVSDLRECTLAIERKGLGVACGQQIRDRDPAKLVLVHPVIVGPRSAPTGSTEG